jgi:hypothetical protein
MDVTRLLQKALIGPHAIHYVNHAMKQMLVPTGVALRKALRDWLASTDGRPYLTAALTSAASVSDDLFREFVNDSELLDHFSVMERATALTVLRSAVVAHDVSDVLKDSALATSLSGRLLHFMNLSSMSMAACAPDVATAAIAYEDGLQKDSVLPASPEFQAAVEAAKGHTA